MKSEAVYLHHILDAIVQVEAYTDGVGESAFFQHPMMQDAVIRQLGLSARGRGGGEA